MVARRCAPSAGWARSILRSASRIRAVAVLRARSVTSPSRSGRARAPTSPPPGGERAPRCTGPPTPWRPGAGRRRGRTPGAGWRRAHRPGRRRAGRGGGPRHPSTNAHPPTTTMRSPACGSSRWYTRCRWSSGPTAANAIASSAIGSRSWVAATSRYRRTPIRTPVSWPSSGSATARLRRRMSRPRLPLPGADEQRPQQLVIRPVAAVAVQCLQPSRGRLLRGDPVRIATGTRLRTGLATSAGRSPGAPACRRRRCRLVNRSRRPVEPTAAAARRDRSTRQPAAVERTPLIRSPGPRPRWARSGSVPGSSRGHSPVRQVAARCDRVPELREHGASLRQVEQQQPGVDDVVRAPGRGVCQSGRECGTRIRDARRHGVRPRAARAERLVDVDPHHPEAARSDPLWPAGAW